MADIFKKVNKWDSPSLDDLFGREPFVETIVKTIESSTEGFNLGISARWGEGKSSILEQLRPKLEDLNYKVLTFEPWKYTQDKISIKRKFIIDIYSQLGENYDNTELYSSHEKPKALDVDEYWGMFWDRLGLFAQFASVVALLFLAILLGFQWLSGIDINITQIFLTNLFIPVLAGVLPLVSKLSEVTIKQTTPKIESAEQFENRFNKAVEEIMSGPNPPKRIIIFVDDLDRCNHTEVEQILTALFTFFNNKLCTYVITADHTVIRRYISHFLQLEDEVNEDGVLDTKKTNAQRDKEATEYLKKIFQINFILPKVPSDLIEKWVKDLIEATAIIEFKNPYAKDYLINLILNNFQNNPRKIKHFIRTLTFQLEAINEKISRLNDKDGEEHTNLCKVKNSPELLAKILIIQDRFPEFYEKISLTPKLLQSHEEGEIAKDKDLQNLLAQEPKFFNSVTRAADRTIDPYYFLYFSGSTGFTEVKVVDPAEIKALARSGDLAGLTKVISGLTDEPRNAQVEYIKREFDVPEVQLPEKLNIVRSLLHTISLIEEPTLKLQKLKDTFNAKAKYAVEFVGLQSIDFSSIILFADIDIINSFFTDEPFTRLELQQQLLEAFISKQSEISNGEVTDRFLQAIADGIKQGDTNSPIFINFARRLAPESFSGSDSIQDALLDLYRSGENPVKLEALETLIICKDKLSVTKHQEFNNMIVEAVSKKPISDALAMMGNIPEKINSTNFDISKIASAAKEKIGTLSREELEQWVNIIFHPAIMKELGSKNLDPILLSLADLINSQDEAKRLYIRTKLLELLSHAADKLALLKLLVGSIKKGPLTESAATLTSLQQINDFWDANPPLKQQFARDLKSTNSSDKEVKALMVKVADELVPPAAVY